MLKKPMTKEKFDKAEAKITGTPVSKKKELENIAKQLEEQAANDLF